LNKISFKHYLSNAIVRDAPVVLHIAVIQNTSKMPNAKSNAMNAHYAELLNSNPNSSLCMPDPNHHILSIEVRLVVPLSSPSTLQLVGGHAARWLGRHGGSSRKWDRSLGAR